MPKRHFRPPTTLVDLCLERCGRNVSGMLKAARVTMLVLRWTYVAQALDTFPTTAGYADLARVTERTGWEHRATIREVLSEDEFRSIVTLLATQEVVDDSRVDAIDVSSALTV